MSIREIREAMNARYLEAFNRGEAAACADLYAEDAAFLLSGSHPVRSRQAIQALHQRFIEAGVKMVSLDTLDSGRAISKTVGIKCAIRPLSGA